MNSLFHLREYTVRKGRTSKSKVARMEVITLMEFCTITKSRRFRPIRAEQDLASPWPLQKFLEKSTLKFVLS